MVRPADDGATAGAETTDAAPVGANAFDGTAPPIVLARPNLVGVVVAELPAGRMVGELVAETVAPLVVVMGPDVVEIMDGGVDKPGPPMDVGMGGAMAGLSSPALDTRARPMVNGMSVAAGVFLLFLFLFESLL